MPGGRTLRAIEAYTRRLLRHVQPVIVANRLAPPAADHARSRLLAALPATERSAA